MTESNGKPPVSRPPQQAGTMETIKETIESILVAFILAFVFRAFIVEAFVIPTGSMATTLLGAHMRFRCEDCGYDFVANYSASYSKKSKDQSKDQSPDDVNIPSVANAGSKEDVTYSVHCPNCGHKVSRGEENSDPLKSATNPPVHYGDRILTLKYLYLLQDPRRWDVVVFKAPVDPAVYHYGQNYIKRLVGKPGEALMLLEGDVYVCPIDQLGKPIDDSPWQVQAKPRSAQDALWRIIFDNDFISRNPKWTMPWQVAAGQGWDTSAGRVLRFANMDGASTIYFNRSANKALTKSPLAFTDWLPYDETRDMRGLENYHQYEAYGNDGIAHWYVSDLKVQFFHERHEGAGPMQVSLSKLDHTFTAELTPDGARVVHYLPGGKSLLVGEAPMDLRQGVVKVEFSNVDYHVTLRLNGKDAIKTTASDKGDLPSDYKPDVKDLLSRHRLRANLSRQGASSDEIRGAFPPPRAQITGERQRATITHLSLWRDIYYTPSGNSHGSPESPIVLHRRGQQTQGSDGKMHECDNEYFVLGDNSILSGDARGWRDPVRLEEEGLYCEDGRVPERFLLGKAFFVYWPAGYRPPAKTAPDLIPNFGAMRFIH